MPLFGDALTAALEIWAQHKLADGATLRRLWYPSSTPEYKFALQKDVSVRTHNLDVDYTFEDIALTLDKVLAQMRKANRPYYRVIEVAMLTIGTDQSKANRMGMSYNNYRQRLYRARKYLGARIDLPSNYLTGMDRPVDEPVTDNV